ncbi:MAG: cytochrome c family protein [Rhizobiaceae bacterium]
MDSFELNKVLGGLLATVFIVLSVGIVSDAIFAAPIPDKPGFEIEAAEDDGHGAGPQEPAGPEPIGPLLAAANPDKGMSVFKAKCTTCHTSETGGANKAGPNLWGIVNRHPASHEGFTYSAGMKAFGETQNAWDYEHLSQFLTAPKALVKGTTMGFAGIKNTAERADVIAFLRTLSDSPAPLPETAAPAAENAAQPGSEGTPPAEGAAAPAGEQPAADTAPAQ